MLKHNIARIWGLILLAITHTGLLNTASLVVPFDGIALKSTETEHALDTLMGQNFYWLIEGIAAGMEQPKKTLATVQALATLNIGAIVALNGDTWDTDDQKDLLLKYGIEHHTFSLANPLTPIPTNLADVKNTISEIVMLSARMASSKKAIVVHCDQGINRTWCILGCWLLAHHPELHSAGPLTKSTLRSSVSSSLKSLRKSSIPFFLNGIITDQEFIDHLIKNRDHSIVALAADFIAKHGTLSPMSDASGTGRPLSATGGDGMPHAASSSTYHTPQTPTESRVVTRTTHRVIPAERTEIGIDPTERAGFVEVKAKRGCGGCCVQ